MPERAPLNVISYLAPNWFGFYQAVTEFLSRLLKRDVRLVQAQFDPLDDPALLHNQLDLAFICGLPFISKRVFEKVWSVTFSTQ